MSFGSAEGERTVRADAPSVFDFVISSFTCSKVCPQNPYAPASIKEQK